MLIRVLFNQLPALDISVNNTATGRQYYQLTKQAYNKQKPFFKDNAEWSVDRLIELASIARTELGWDWLADSYDLSTTAQLHKDLEHTVGQVGFENIPEEYDWLLYDLHHCLHGIQHSPDVLRACNLQIEWLVDDHVPLPDDFEFSETLCRGDLILINPYVGHNPLQIYWEQDYIDLSTTCKFHDVIKPGIVLASGDFDVSKQTILNAFKQHAPEFVKQAGEDTVLYYSGSARIGSAVDKDVFEKIMNYTDKLELIAVEFH